MSREAMVASPYHNSNGLVFISRLSLCGNRVLNEPCHSLAYGIFNQSAHLAAYHPHYYRIYLFDRTSFFIILSVRVIETVGEHMTRGSSNFLHFTPTLWKSSPECRLVCVPSKIDESRGDPRATLKPTFISMQNYIST